MSVVASQGLHQLIENGVIDALHDNVNSASIDIRIGDKILLETGHGFLEPGEFYDLPVDIDAKRSPHFTEVPIPPHGLVIDPGQCFLASTMETFNLPNNISAQFKLRSSLGRCFLEHMNAGWADAGWNGAQLTMEFKNMNQYHRLLIKPGMRVGQMIFFEHEDAGADSYSVKGNYNGQKGPTMAFAGSGHTKDLV